MTTFLGTTGLSYQLEELIKGAKERLVLVCPYWRVNQRLRTLLEDQARFKIDMRIVYGKTELESDQAKWLQSMPVIRMSYCEHLHAKCYLSESRAIITSMNLYEFSQLNNIEMGILIERTEDPELYGAVWNEIQALLRSSEEQDAPSNPQLGTVSSCVEPTKHPFPESATIGTTATSGPQGCCIRCRRDLPANLTKPYCRGCFEHWRSHKDDAHQESYCHLCGKSHPATLKRPACRACFAKHKLATTPATAAWA